MREEKRCPHYSEIEAIERRLLPYERWSELTADELRVHGDTFFAGAHERIEDGCLAEDRTVLEAGLRYSDAARRCYSDYLFQYQCQPFDNFPDEVRERLGDQVISDSDAVEVWATVCDLSTVAIKVEHQLGYRPTHTISDGRRMAAANAITLLPAINLERAVDSLGGQVPERLATAFEQLVTAYDQTSDRNESWLGNLSSDIVAKARRSFIRLAPTE